MLVKIWNRIFKDLKDPLFCYSSKPLWFPVVLNSLVSF